jgi:hypothetical protein
MWNGMTWKFENRSWEESTHHVIYQKPSARRESIHDHHIRWVYSHFKVSSRKTITMFKQTLCPWIRLQGLWQSISPVHDQFDPHCTLNSEFASSNLIEFGNYHKGHQSVHERNDIMVAYVLRDNAFVWKSTQVEFRKAFCLLQELIANEVRWSQENYFGLQETVGNAGESSVINSDLRVIYKFHLSVIIEIANGNVKKKSSTKGKGRLSAYSTEMTKDRNECNVRELTQL